MKQVHSQDTFLHELDSVLSHVNDFEQLQKRLLDRLLKVSGEVIFRHCHEQQNHLSVITAAPALTENECTELRECSNQYEQISRELPQTFDEVDVVIQNVYEADDRVTQFLRALKAEIEADAPAKRASEKVHAAHEKMKNTYAQIGLNALLIVGGALLAGLSMGAGVPEGGSLIMEGVSGLAELVDDAKKSTQEQKRTNMVRTYPIVNVVAMTRLKEIENRNRDLLNESWTRIVSEHAEGQYKTLASLENRISTYDDRITSVLADYQESLKELSEINKIVDELEKTEVIQKAALRVQKADRDAQAILKTVAPSLSLSEKKEAKNFVACAKTFYEKNQKMIRVAGLLALTAVGVGLTIATGGIAAAVGAAMLATVALTPLRSMTMKCGVLPVFEKKSSNALISKPSSEDLAKTTLAVGAVIALGVLTGGVGLVVAFGCATLSWGASKAIKKVAEYRKSKEKPAQLAITGPDVAIVKAA